MNKKDQEKIALLRAIASGGEVGDAQLVGDPYSDDHILCCDVRLRARGSPKWVKVSFLWCGWEIVAAVRYASDSAAARKELTRYIKDQVKEYANDEEGNEELLGQFKGFN